MSGWAEEEAGGGGGGGQRHLATHLLLLNPLRAGAGRWAGAGRRTQTLAAGGRPPPWAASLVSGQAGRQRGSRAGRWGCPYALDCALDQSWLLGRTASGSGVGLWRAIAVGPSRRGKARGLQVLGADSPPPSGRSGKPAFRRRRGGHGHAKGAGRGPSPAGGLGPGSQRRAGPHALNVSRRGAAGEPGHPAHPSSAPRLAATPCGAACPDEEWCAAPARAGTPPAGWTPKSPPTPAPASRAAQSELVCGRRSQAGCGAPRQPTDPIKYYLCFKIPVIGYAAAFSETRAKRSKIAVRPGLFSSCKFPFL